MQDVHRQPAFDAILLVGDALVGQCGDAGTTGLAVDLRAATPVATRPPAEAPGDNDKQTSGDQLSAKHQVHSLSSLATCNQPDGFEQEVRCSSRLGNCLAPVPTTS